jgi:hypothetical protein
MAVPGPQSCGPPKTPKVLMCVRLDGIHPETLVRCAVGFLPCHATFGCDTLSG